MKTILQLGAFTLFSVLLLTNTSHAQQGPAANVNVTVVEQKTLSPVAWVSGSVVSRNDSKIASEVSGRLIHLADLGSHVKKDQVIAQLDDRTIKLRLIEEQANVDNNQAKLSFENAEVKRKKILVKKKLIAATDLEETIANRNIAKAKLAAAQARLAQTQQDLTYSQLKAPFNGIVAQRLSNQGEYISNGTAIIRLVETANLEASLFAPLTAYQYLTPNQTLTIRSPFGDESAPIKAIIPVADARSHLMEVRLDMSKLNWPIGLNIKAAVATGASKQVLAIPRDALVLRRNAISIFRIDQENIAQQVEVSIGISEGEWVEVIGDIKAGDQIVVRGAERLRAGQKVAIKTNNLSLISGK
jgi:RND family efflux transporter MFP subunit